jgi:hypothetical protein
VQWTGTTSSPLFYDLTVNTHQYYIQSLWVNAESGYFGMGIESVSIAASPPPQPLAVSEVGTFGPDRKQKPVPQRGLTFRRSTA